MRKLQGIWFLKSLLCLRAFEASFSDRPHNAAALSKLQCSLSERNCVDVICLLYCSSLPENFVECPEDIFQETNKSFFKVMSNIRVEKFAVIGRKCFLQ